MKKKSSSFREKFPYFEEISRCIIRKYKLFCQKKSYIKAWFSLFCIWKVTLFWKKNLFSRKTFNFRRIVLMCYKNPLMILLRVFVYPFFINTYFPFRLNVGDRAIFLLLKCDLTRDLTANFNYAFRDMPTQYRSVVKFHFRSHKCCSSWP